MSQELWNERAAARGIGAAIGVTAVAAGYAAEAAFVGQIGAAEARALYLSRVEQIATNAAGRLKNGDAVEAVAKDVVQARNLLKLEIRELAPWAAARAADMRNLVTYGNRAGPSAEQLLQKYGSWEKVIEAVQRTNQLVNKLVK